jgi:hypothetical protein
MVTKSYKKRLIVCFAGVLLALCFHHFVSKKIEFVTYSNGNLKIQDYAYYIILVKAFWFNGFGNIYEILFHQKALSMHLGTKIYYVMPLGITPIALIVWFPFAYVACFSMALSYTLWITFSVSVLLFAFWSVIRHVFRRKNPPILPITLFVVTLFSWSTLHSVYLGQTSVLAAGLLIYLIYIAHNTVNKSRSDNWLLIPLLIFFLGIKPSYLALGLGLLVIYGMWKEVLYSIVLILVFIIGVTPMLGLEWVSSYLKTLPIYALENIPDIYAWSIALETMNIFRSAFHNIIGDNLASLISTIVTCSVYIGVVWLSISAKIKGKSADSSAPLRVTKDQLFILIIGSYLLFAPYAGAYEDVLFLPVFSTVLLTGNTPDITNYKSLVLIFSLFVILLHSYFPPDKLLWLFWLLKALIIGYMLHFCQLKKERKECTN